MSGNFAIKGGGVGRLMANAILNFHFDFPHPSLRKIATKKCLQPTRSFLMEQQLYWLAANQLLQAEATTCISFKTVNMWHKNCIVIELIKSIFGQFSCFRKS